MSAENRTKGQFFPIIIVVLIALVAGGLYYYGVRQQSVNYSANSDVAAPFEGSLAPDFALQDLTGKKVRLSDLRGKVVFLNFFATWCEPCRSELPDFNRMHLRFQREGKDATFLLVNVREQPTVVKQFMQANGYSLPTLTDVDGSAAASYLVQGIPATFIIGPDGKIITKRVGAISASLLEALVKQVVN